MNKIISKIAVITCFLFSISDNWASAFSALSHAKPFVKSSISMKHITSETGKDIYLKYCMSCHQVDGSGVPFTYPSLQKSNWLNGDKTKLIKVVLNGLEGEIDVNGEIFNASMPKQDNLTDKQIALVLTYLRQNFGNKASVVTPGEVKKLRINSKDLKHTVL